MAATESETQAHAAEIETEARRTGWVPKDQYHGTRNWIDAEAWVKRANEVLPYVTASNKQLRADNEALQSKAAAQDARISELQTQLDGLKKFQTEAAVTQRKQIRAQLLEELKQAREDNDVEAEVRINDQIAATREPPAPAGGDKPSERASGGPVASSPPAAVQKPQLSPAFKDWLARNPWFEQNIAMRSTAVAVSAELNAAGKLAGLSESERYELMAKETLKYFPPAQRGGASRVEGGRPSAAGGPSAAESDRPTYENLPDFSQDPTVPTKATCDAQARNLDLVGPTKAFKTIQEWRQHYAEMVA